MLIPILTILSILFSLFYAVLMLLFRHGLKHCAEPLSQIKRTVSVCIPAHNEENNLPHLLTCLKNQSYPNNLTEIILIDDRSSDRTYDLMRAFAKAQDNATIVRITQTPINSPKKNALNTAISQAGGDIILTTDADTSPGPHWVEDMVRTFTPDTGMVLGYAPYRTDGPYHTFFHRMLALEYMGMGVIAAASAGLGFPITCNGANLAYKRSTFLETGGFGDSIRLLSGDDDLLMQRFKQNTKERIVFSNSAQTPVFNQPPASIKQFFRQRIRFSSKHPAYSKSILTLLSGVYGYYVWLLFLLVAAFFSIPAFLLLVFMLINKTVFELLFLMPAQRQFESRRLMTLYPIATVLHIFYIVLIPILAQLLPKRWK